MKKFSVKFRSGFVNTFEGENIINALNNAGYSEYIMESIESWEEICDCSTSNKSNVLMEGVVTWISSQEGLISIKDALDRNHYSIDIALNNILKEYIGKKVKIIKLKRIN